MRHIDTLLTKLCTLLLVALCCGSLAKAQSSMVITKTDGTQLTIRVADIQEVTFPSDDLLHVNLGYSVFWLKPEQWMQLEAVCTSPEGEEVDTNITWKSTDEAVAKVNKNGTVTGIGDGTCQIVASTENGQASLTINVTSKTMLDIDVTEVGNLSCSYIISPSDPSLRYYSLLRIQSGEYSVDGMTQYGSEEQNCYHFALDWWQFCADMYGMTWVEFMNETGLTSGRSYEHEEGLKPGSQYCIFAFAMNEDGTLASPIEMKKFTTTNPQPSDITFDVTVDNITSNEATFTVVPSNNDKYFVNVQRASYVDWFVENNCVESNMVPDLTSTMSPNVYPEAYCQGTVTRSSSDFLSSLRKNTDYYIIVFGYDEGLTSEVTLVPFHTLP